MKKFKWNEDRSGVMVVGEGMFIPRGHRFWEEYGVADAERKGEIEEFLTAEDRAQQWAQEEQAWVKEELGRMDLEVLKHYDGDERAVSDLEAVKKYRRELRDYVRNEGGRLVVVGNRPMLGMGA